MAIVGRPNVGKSTLLNKLLGQKISITSRKPQTTRQRILGIRTTATYQVIYIDTPGLQWPPVRAINRSMNRVASSALVGVDLVVWMVEGLRWTAMDAAIQTSLTGVAAPVLCAVNKIDRVVSRDALLPYLEWIGRQISVAEIVPLAAGRGENTQRLEELVVQYLPKQGPVFPKDQFTDRSQRFLAAEFVREKLIRRLASELPYRVNVQIERYVASHQVLHIDAVIWVEKASQKAIVIGTRGEVLKGVGSAARKDMERLFGKRVFLQLWVKVQENGSNDGQALRKMGYVE